jgi:hypothetical protein
VTDDFNVIYIYRFILHHNRVSGSKILNGIELRGFNFRGPITTLYLGGFGVRFLFQGLSMQCMDRIMEKSSEK